MNKSVITKIANNRGFDSIEYYNDSNIGERLLYCDVNEINLAIRENENKIEYMFYYLISEQYCLKSAYFEEINNVEKFKKHYEEFKELIDKLKWEDDL